jgi:oligoribonuclease (3'-5' exoribonuclease)
MIYVALDTETTGLDFEKDQVLQIGAIIEDTNNLLSFEEIPKFNCLVKHDFYHFSNEYAVNLNSWIFSEFLKNKKSDYTIHYKENVISYFYEWLISNIKGFDKITIAGKNPSFDKRFLQNLPNCNDLIKFNHRSIDPVALFTDFKNDTILPSLETCKERANLDNKIVSHNALEDAWDIIQILRTKY